MQRLNFFHWRIIIKNKNCRNCKSYKDTKDYKINKKDYLQLNLKLVSAT
jgi:hypothetical protein